MSNLSAETPGESSRPILVMNFRLQGSGMAHDDMTVDHVVL